MKIRITEDNEGWLHKKTKEVDNTKVVATKVAYRFIHKTAADRYDGKIVSKDARLRWSDAIWMLEELPQKGKKKLRVAQMQNPVGIFLGRLSGVVNLLPQNVLRSAGISKSDSYESMKKKIEEAMLKAAESDVSAGTLPNWVAESKGNIKWYESQVYFLEVVPEDVDPFRAKGKDFEVYCEWGEFSASRMKSKAEAEESDAYAQSGDPHYSNINSKSKGAARKLYQTLKADPNALKSVTWNDFPKWLDTKKIGYTWSHSLWH